MSTGFHEIHCQSRAYYLAFFLEIFLTLKNLCLYMALVSQSSFCYDFWSPLWSMSLDFNEKINFNDFHFVIKWTKNGASGTLWAGCKNLFNKTLILLTLLTVFYENLRMCGSAAKLRTLLSQVQHLEEKTFIQFESHPFKHEKSA